MENQEGLERLVLYRTEEELQRDSVMVRSYITDDYDSAIKEILRGALGAYSPWRNFSIKQSDVKDFFYSNALTCALLTFNYLSAPDTTLTEIMCDTKNNEVVEGNMGLQNEMEEFQEKCESIRNSDELWKEKIREVFDSEDVSADVKEKVEDYLDSIKLPHTYVFFSKEKIKNFLTPIAREIVCEMIEREKKETIDYKMKEVLCLYTKHLDGRRPVNEWDDLFDDNHENDIQRRYKSNLARAYDSFCEKLEENGKEQSEKCKGCNRYESCRKCESCSEYMMNEFAREMIYHRRAIIEFENHMIKLKNISNTMDPNILDILKEDIDRWEWNLYFKCTVPVAFCPDGRIFENMYFSRMDYIWFLKYVIIRVYVLAMRNPQKAYDILKNYIDRRNPRYQPLKDLKLMEKPSSQKKIRTYAIRCVLQAISPTWLYEETEPDDLMRTLYMGVSDIK